MESGYYAALTGLLARTQALDVIANNLANTATAGYKAQREFYSALTASSNAAQLSPLNRAVNDYSVLGGMGLDLSQGNLQPTGNPLDLALQGGGFFVANTPRGIRYTRNGHFHLSTKGILLSDTGDPILDPRGKPIRLPAGPVTVSSDGTISADGTIVAKLQIANFAAGVALTPEGASYFAAPVGAARPAAAASVVQGSLEQANLSPIEGMVGLIELQRNAELLQKALTTFDRDFNQTAVTDLPHIS